MPSVESRQLADGTTRFFVRVRDPQRGKFTSETFLTRPEAERFIRDIANRGAAWALDERRREKSDLGEPTLDQWAAIHFDALTKANPDTVARYRRVYDHNWKPALGHMRLSQISRTDVAKALNALPGSDKTVKNKWAVLTHMLKLAAQDGLIPRSPTGGIPLPVRTAHEVVEHRYLTQAEFWRVLDATPPYWKPFVLTLAGTGMRWGEAAALNVGDVDLENATLRINKAEKRDAEHPSKRIVGPTKTAKSRRSIALPDEVVEALRPLCDRPRTERLFLPPKGGPLRHKTFYYDIWQRKILANAGLEDPQPRIHDLRHSHVAWLIAEGVPLPVIQARLGHEKITTTIDTYGHLTPDLQRQAKRAASVVLGSRPKELG